jgi:hypothetical protein
VAEESIQCALSELEANNACGPAAERVRAPQDLNSTRVAPVPALLTALLLATVMAAPANAEGPTLKVNVFQGMHTVELHIAPSPDEQRAGHFDLGHRTTQPPTDLLAHDFISEHRVSAAGTRLSDDLRPLGRVNRQAHTSFASTCEAGVAAAGIRRISSSLMRRNSVATNAS